MSKRLSPTEKEFRRNARRAFELALKTGLVGWSVTSKCGTVSTVSTGTPIRVDENTFMTVCLGRGPGAFTI